MHRGGAVSSRNLACLHWHRLPGCAPGPADLRDPVERDVQRRRELPGPSCTNKIGGAQEMQAWPRQEARQVRQGQGQEEEDQSQESQQQAEGKSMTTFKALQKISQAGRTSLRLRDIIRQSGGDGCRGVGRVGVWGLALVCAALTMFTIVGVGAAPAVAETPGPGWELTSRTFPTNLPPAVNDVQQVVVNATGGTFTLSFLSRSFEESTTVAIPYNAEAAVVQSDLEALPEIGAGNVVVTGGPGSYVITFTGRLGARGISKLTAHAGELTGGAQTATVTVQTEGAGRGTVEVDIVNV